jgi:hypothetical protein
MWKGLYGCGGQADQLTWSDATTTCTSMCGAKQGELDLCGMRGVGHDLNNPFQVGGGDIQLYNKLVTGACADVSFG